MLSKADIEHFALHGYVVMRQAIDPQLLRKAADLVWRNAPTHFSKDDPSTWRDAVIDCRGELSISERFGLVKLRNEIGQNAELLDITISNPTLQAFVSQLLGADNIGPWIRPRGIYPIFPTPEHAGVEVNAHIDFTPAHFVMTIGVYVDEVPQGGGGLNVWPGSHRGLHYLTRTTGCEMSDIATPDFLAAFSAWNRTAPTTICGQAGDVILFHHRLAHAPSINVTPGHVRLAAYFNVYTKDPKPRTPGSLWEQWEGVRSLRSTAAKESDRFVQPPPPERYAMSRRELPKGGAWPGFLDLLNKTVVRASRSAIAAA